MTYEEFENHIEIFHCEINGQENICFGNSALSDLFGFKDTKTVDYLIERAGYEANKNSLGTVYKNSLITLNDQIYLTATGVYILILLSKNLKNYNNFTEHLDYFKNLAFNDLLQYYKKSLKKPARRKSINEFTPITEDDYLKLQDKKLTLEDRMPNLNNVEDRQHLFYGKKVVITGVFERWPLRQDLAKLLTSLGAIILTNITGKTDYVILGKEAGPVKLQKIEDMGLKTFDEEQFTSII